MGIILDYPGGSIVISKIFIRGKRKVKIREKLLIMEAKIEVTQPRPEECLSL